MQMIPCRRRRWACIAMLVLVAGAARAAENDPAGVPEIDPEAVKTARSAGDFLRKKKHFSFTAETAYEVVQADGAKLEFGATRRYLVRRPDRVRIEVEPREGDARLVLFDGDQLTIAHPEAKLFAQIQLKDHRDIDAAIDALRVGLDVPIPLGELLRSDPREDLVDALTDAYVVGAATIRGTECDHVVLRYADTDLQLWIAHGDAPLLQRLVITYRSEEGAPTFAADLRDWAFDPKPSDDSFRYAAPADAQRIPFAIPTADPRAPTAEAGAEKQ
jgi:hypothetical protein